MDDETGVRVSRKEAYREFGEHHETQSLYVLSQLRLADLRRVPWERINVGARISPCIDVLRNGYGFNIVGTGRRDDPYILVDKKQAAQRMRVTKEVKAAYYATEHWSQMRIRRIDFDYQQCVQCHEEDGLHVHHWVYDIFREKIEELLTLCPDCHDEIHRVAKIGWPQGISWEDAERLGFERSEELC